MRFFPFYYRNYNGPLLGLICARLAKSRHTRQAASDPTMRLWICSYVVLHLQLIEHIEIGVQVVIPVQSL